MDENVIKIKQEQQTKNYIILLEKQIIKLSEKIKKIETKSSFHQNKKIPIYIIITKVILNNDILLNEDKLVWHEDYISIKKEVMNNDEFFIHVEWKPLSPFQKLIKL